MEMKKTKKNEKLSDFDYQERDNKTYLLCWNPSTDDFKTEHYSNALKRFPGGFCYNWELTEWEDANEFDYFYMMRVDEGNTGIIFRGMFTSEPFEVKDEKTGEIAHYVDIDCYEAVPPEETPKIPLKVLQKELPNIEWDKLSKGMLLSIEEEATLDRLWDESANK